MSSPTQRTLNLLRKDGYLAEVVERVVPGGRFRRDLFGIFDVVGIAPDARGVLGIQCTTCGNLSARVSKMLVSPALVVWLLAGNRAEAWGWAKFGRAGSRKLWQVRRRVFMLPEDGLPYVSTNGVVKG